MEDRGLVSTELLVSILSFAGTLLLVLTGLMNFSVFIRQLRNAREQLDTARRQLEHAQLQPEIQLIQRAMVETSEYLHYFVERPYLRPYFYAGKNWKEGDRASADEVLAMAELILHAFASAIIHAAAFPQYPARSVEQTIRFHFHQSPALREFLFENFDRYTYSGLALLCLKNATKDEIESDLHDLVAASDGSERARREQLLALVEHAETADPFELAKYIIRCTEAQPSAVSKP
jgi:hypothetical protein